MTVDRMVVSSSNYCFAERTPSCHKSHAASYNYTTTTNSPTPSHSTLFFQIPRYPLQLQMNWHKNYLPTWTHSCSNSQIYCRHVGQMVLNFFLTTLSLDFEWEWWWCLELACCTVERWSERHPRHKTCRLQRTRTMDRERHHSVNDVDVGHWPAKNWFWTAAEHAVTMRSIRRQWRS